MNITIPKDLFDALLEDAKSLRGEWSWETHQPSKCEYDALCSRIEQALALRREAEGK